MSLITLQKTWERSRKISVGTTLSKALTAAMVGLKDALVSSGHWTVQQSSDGMLSGANDYWESESSIVAAVEGSAHSWIVLRNSEILGGNFEVCINFNNASYYNLSVYCSHTGYNIDGTITTKPTAIISSHEQIVANQQNYASSPSLEWRILVLTSSDGQCTRCIFTNTTTFSGCCGIWLFDKIKNPPSWLTMPYIAIADPRSGSGDYSFRTTASNFPQYVNFCHATGGIARSWHEDTPIKVTFGTIGSTTPYGNTVMGRIARSDTGAYPIYPIYVLSLDTSVPGFLGMLYDIYWLPSNFGDSAGTIFNASSLGSCPLVYLPTSNSEQGMFNWGVWAFGDTGEGGLF